MVSCKYKNKIKNGRISLVMGYVVVAVALHLCDVSFWPCPVLSVHSVLEQQQKTRYIKSNH